MLTTVLLRKPAEALSIARLILQCHAERRVFAFRGELGAGKTTLIKAFCAALGVEDHTSSPSFAIVNEYRTQNGPVHHFDLYRLRSPEELEGIGFTEYVDSGSYCFVEWPELAADLLPQETLVIHMELSATGVRTLRMAAGPVPYLAGPLSPTPPTTA
ncbi:MAG: tRNA (adenosine(37)-N6)-threonylcarbamoyltransferase complex ATPase subunit type 1 TsaE [Flavobacteriales bacterium]|nr:tRNA (adenosine(37)-N6)-threonylcarbamoyltransferase complex ATPase subunit type 1 TsaE [Flavobacteriales bacterium]